MERVQVGIIAPALGVPDETIQRFTESVHQSAPGCSYRVRIAKGLGDPEGLPNISRARNIGIRSLLDSCEVVVCADVDLLVPPGLVDQSYKVAMTHSCLWARAKHVRDAAEPYPWEAWKASPIREVARGTWNAMRWQEWVRSGGWDERCRGWGGEDDALTRDISEAGIPTYREDGFPLMHVHHAHRTRRHVGENTRIGQPTEWNWLVPNAAMTLFVTSRCNMQCNECSVAGLRGRDPAYSMPMEEVALFVALTRRAGYRFRVIVLSGGEPTLWPHLRGACRFIRESGIANRIKILTNGSCAEAITPDLVEVVDDIVISVHNTHHRAEQIARKFPGTVRIADRTTHYAQPTGPMDGVLPAKCVCGFGYFLYASTVGLCPMQLTVMPITGAWPHIMPLRGRYLDELMNVDRYRQPACRVCVSNERVRDCGETVKAHD